MNVHTSRPAAIGHVSASVKQALAAQMPRGSARHIELYIADEMLVLDLTREFTGLPPFVISGQFKDPTKDLTFGDVTLPKASVLGFYVTAWITPAALAPGSHPQPPVGDQAVKEFTWAGQDANLKDTYNVGKRNVPRTGAILMQDWLAHFKRLRRVKQKGKDSGLILHDEAASRLEAVEQELGPDNTPTTLVGWPRAECSLAGTRGGDPGLFDLHTIGFAVDFNATEMPHLKDDVRLRDLILLVTGKVELSVALSKQTKGEYEAMAREHVEQRRVMADPDPSSELGQLIDHIKKAAREASSALSSSALALTRRKWPTCAGYSLPAKRATKVLGHRAKGEVRT